MTDIVIRTGGVVEVDTASLRAVSRKLHSYARELGELATRALSVLHRVQEWPPGTAGFIFTVGDLVSAIHVAESEAEEIAEAVQSAAALYEAVELCVARDAAAAAGDDRRVEVLDARLDRLTAADPESVAAARRALDDPHGIRRDLFAQALVGTLVFGPGSLLVGFPLLSGAIDRLRGTVPATSRLTGAEVPVTLRTATTGAAKAPATMADAAARIPTGEARVRVEKYMLPSGERQFFVYAAGTSTAGGSSQVFDARSNVQLYTGVKSASYSAVTSALRDAGARPGDVLHGFGHSQGGMVLERLALEGEFEVQTLVSYGSPVQADVGSETLAVSVRHTDDPVPGLQGGGHPHSVGASGSFVVERSGDLPAGVPDLDMSSHHMVEYLDTAARIDASPDPRVDELRDVFARWEGAAGEGSDYVATRISPDGGSGAG